MSKNSSMTSHESNKNIQVFVFDNDECIGALSLASAIHSIFATYVPKNTGILEKDCLSVLKGCLIKHYFSNGGARPGTKAILNLVKLYKEIGIIDKVVMFTSAPNGLGWVDFLKECIEDYCECPGLYDLVLHRDNTPVTLSSDGATVKSLDLVRRELGIEEKKNSIVMFDDKPHNIRGEGARVDVTPYRHVVEEKHINDMLDDVIDTLQKMYIRTEWKTYTPDQLRPNIKNIILVDKNGLPREVRVNTCIYHCPLDQRTDTNLIEKGVKAFMEHIVPVPLVRTVSDNIASMDHVVPVISQVVMKRAMTD